MNFIYTLILLYIHDPIILSSVCKEFEIYLDKNKSLWFDQSYLSGTVGILLYKWGEYYKHEHQDTTRSNLFKWLYNRMSYFNVINFKFEELKHLRNHEMDPGIR